MGKLWFSEEDIEMGVRFRGVIAETDESRERENRIFNDGYNCLLFEQIT